jgi:CheY-like chemotaxis protein
VTAVADGKEAWAAIRSEHYDLLITDQQMHNSNGAELILQIRLAGNKLPVIVAASDLQPFDKSTCHDLMVTAVIQKPFGLKKLGQAIALALSPTSDQFRGRAHASNARLHPCRRQAKHESVLA